MLKAIRIKITSFIGNDQLGFVECKFHDAWNNKYTIHDKIPIVTKKYLDANSEYPQEGLIACEIVKKWVDKDGRKILTVSTEKPWAVETINGLTEFDILEEQLIEVKEQEY